MPIILAEADSSRIVIWSIALLALLVAGWFTVAWVKRWVSASDDGPADGFTLSDLRRLHRSGQMSDEEFERAKGAIVDATRRAAERERAKAEGRGPAGPDSLLEE